MDGTFEKRLGAAVFAAWWTIVIGALFVTFTWAAYMLFIYTRPGWLLTLWGGGALDWAQVQMIFIIFVAAFKLLLFLLVMVTICLTLWLRRLRQIP